MAKCKACNGTGVVLLTDDEKAAIREKIAEKDRRIAEMEKRLAETKLEIALTEKEMGRIRRAMQ